MQLYKKLQKSLLHEIFNADDLVLISDSIEGIQRKFANWKELLESKGLKINNQKTKLMVSSFKGNLLISKIDPCGVL